MLCGHGHEPQRVILSCLPCISYIQYFTVATASCITHSHQLQEVWDALFLGKGLPSGHSFPQDVLQRMRHEFNFWYPMDLRVSGKDLIQNHLTFCLYNHTAIFPKELWPRAFRTNGHLLLNSEKMSKGTGNFLTLDQACSACLLLTACLHCSLCSS